MLAYQEVLTPLVLDDLGIPESIVVALHRRTSKILGDVDSYLGEYCSDSNNIPLQPNRRLVLYVAEGVKTRLTCLRLLMSLV